MLLCSIPLVLPSQPQYKLVVFALTQRALFVGLPHLTIVFGTHDDDMRQVDAQKVCLRSFVRDPPGGLSQHEVRPRRKFYGRSAPLRLVQLGRRGEFPHTRKFLALRSCPFPPPSALVYWRFHNSFSISNATRRCDQRCQSVKPCFMAASHVWSMRDGSMAPTSWCVHPSRQCTIAPA
jgi:hypothetical protein